MARLALRTLKDALAQAEHGRVVPQWWHRLALTCLLQVKIAEPWQCRNFWKVLNDPYAWASHHTGVHYMRTSHLVGCLDNWYHRAGMKSPSPVERGHRANALVCPIDSADPESELARMCNRYTPGDRQTIMDLFNARALRQFNAGPGTVHPKDPGWVVRVVDGEMVLDQMTWGFPLVMKGKMGQPLKPKPVNNARFDKLLSPF